jgi:serralysin
MMNQQANGIISDSIDDLFKEVNSWEEVSVHPSRSIYQKDESLLSLLGRIFTVQDEIGVVNSSADHQKSAAESSTQSFGWLGLDTINLGGGATSPQENRHLQNLSPIQQFGMGADAPSSPTNLMFGCSCPSCINPANTLTTSSGGSTPQAVTTAGSLANALISGSKWTLPTSRTLTYSFYEDTVFNGAYYGSETGVKEVSEAVKTNTRNIFNWISTIIDVNFAEVQETSTSTFGQLRLMLSDNPGYAYAYLPSSSNLGGDVHLKSTYDYLGETNGFQNTAGNHGYMSLVHEIGHSLGLKHSFDGTTILDPAWDNTSNTVMTYNFTGSSAGTFMPLDIVALQSLYGAKNYNSNNDSYLFSRIDQFSVNGQAGLTTAYSTKQTIWDNGGVDTLDFSRLSATSAGYRLDLNPGGIIARQANYNATSYSVNGITYYTTTYGTEIAYNTLIENAINSSSNDEIFLNSAANTIGGYSAGRVVGNDIVWNATSADVLDLSGYSASMVTQGQIGNDLSLGLGTNGSVTIKDYYLGSQLAILYGNTLGLSIGDVSVVEGNSGTTAMVFTVSLSGASATPVSVDYALAGQSATAGVDYSGANGTLTFAAGEVLKTITVLVSGDGDIEGNETLLATLSNPTGNVVILDGQGVGTIVNDDVAPTMSIGDFSVNENGTANVTVVLSRAATQVVTASYSTADGTAIAGQDYVAINNGLVSFNPGEVQKTFTIAPINDSLYEPTNETFLVNLGNVQNAVIADGQAVGTIMDNDLAPTFSLSMGDVSMVEGTNSRKDTTLTFTVNLLQASTQKVSVQYITANGSAVSGSDYVAQSGTLTFSAGQTSKTIAVKVKADSVAELTENFMVNIFNATNATIGRGQAIGTILNDDNGAITSNTNLASTVFNSAGAGVDQSLLFNARAGQSQDSGLIPNLFGMDNPFLMGSQVQNVDRDAMNLLVPGGGLEVSPPVNLIFGQALVPYAMF